MEQTEFESLPIPEVVLKGIRDAGFEHCTPIQGKTLPITLAGKDVAGQAQTGTGKTAAFLISMYARLLKKKVSKPKNARWVAPRALIVAPTRELAIQIEKDALMLGKYCDFKTVCVYGGIDYEKQKNEIKKGADILIATPGRFIDYYKQKFFSLKEIEVLIIDEADRMFDMGFIQDIRYILRNTSRYDKRLTMLYSATLNHRVLELCYEHMNEPVPIKIEPEKMVVDEVKQTLYHVGSHEKFNLLLGILKTEEGEKVLIFTNTKATAERLEAKLKYNDLDAAQISGDLHQKKRMQVLEKFSEGNLDILIATDVASRGLHVDNISHVINYDVPQDPEDYIHRIGRTARAGASGDAITLACENYAVHLEPIHETLKTQIPVEWPSDDMFVKGKEGEPPRRPRKPRPPMGKKSSGKPRSSGSGRGPRSSSGGRPRRSQGAGGRRSS